MVQLNLTDERWDPACRYAAEAYPGQPLAFGIRELLLVAIGVDPLEAATVAARAAAYTAMTNLVRQRMLSSLGPFYEMLQTEEARAIAAATAQNEEKAA